MKNKIAFVVQRYGLEINGGSELLCRQLAERMAGGYDVTVLTSCAVDYMTWKNDYAPGEHEIEGVRVLRFPVDKQRKDKRFARISQKTHADRENWELGIYWQQEQGPHCPGLLEYIQQHKEEYCAILFMTYLYSPTYFGIHLAPEHSILIPTAHDEAPIYLNIFTSEFHLPKYLIYQTLAEKDFVTGRFHNGHIPSCVAGAGVEIPAGVPEVDVEERFGIQGDYVVYVGRIDVNKNCDVMIDDFIRYQTRTRRDVTLVLVGKTHFDLPSHPAVLPVGFVSDEDKFNLIQKARVLLLPSQFESLSLSTLEAMYLETPVLVNGTCDVLKQHCIDSDGAGLYYTNGEEFENALDTLLNDAALCRTMGRKGHRYASENYRWEAIIERISQAVEYVAAL